MSVYEQVVVEQQGKPLNELPWSTRAKGADLMQRIALSAVIERFEQMRQRELPLTTRPGH